MAGFVSILAGVMFLSGEALARIAPDTDDVACISGAAYLVNIIDLLKYGMMGVAVLFLIRIGGDQLSKAGRISGRVAAAGSIIAGVANGIEHCAHLDSFGAIYVSGLLIGLISTVVFGVFVAKSRAVTPWVGWVISGGVLAFILRAEEGGAVLVGLAWIAVGARLMALGRAAPAV
jgi:hypothetical protein